jgi:hypothetical protein
LALVPHTTLADGRRTARDFLSQHLGFTAEEAAKLDITFGKAAKKMFRARRGYDPPKQMVPGALFGPLYTYSVREDMGILRDAWSGLQSHSTKVRKDSLLRLTA